MRPHYRGRKAWVGDAPAWDALGDVRGTVPECPGAGEALRAMWQSPRFSLYWSIKQAMAASGNKLTSPGGRVPAVVAELGPRCAQVTALRS